MKLLFASLTLAIAAPSISLSQEETWVTEDGATILVDSSETSPATPPVPFEGDLFTRSKLLGDPLGLRSAMMSHGITLDVSNTQYYMGIANGGVQETTKYGGRSDYFVNIDGEKLGLSKGFFISLHGETRYGESINRSVGTFLPANLGLTFPDPFENVTALTGVKFMQFLSENFLTFAGKINTFDEFRQPLTGATLTTGFLNAGLMFNPVVIRTVPYSTLGAGFAVLKDLEPVLAFTVLDATDSPTTSGFDTFFQNGVSMLGQLTLPTNFFGLPGHHGLIASYSTRTYTSLTPSVYYDPSLGLILQPGQETGSWSVAYNFDQAFYVSPDDPQKRWGVFGNVGLADNNPSPINWYASGGISGVSPLRGRSEDSFGIGYFFNGISNNILNLAPNLLPLRQEHGFEVYYNYALTPWCHITPDLQVITPIRERLDTTLILGVRMKIDF